jgi:glutaminyl-peptide cyclotransferase
MFGFPQIWQYPRHFLVPKQERCQKLGLGKFNDSNIESSSRNLGKNKGVEEVISRNILRLICGLVLTLSSLCVATAQSDSSSDTQDQQTKSSTQAQKQDQAPQKPIDPSGFDGDYAFQILKAICDLGPRVSASEPMLKQQQMIREHFEGLGATVINQDFLAAHPLDNKRQVQLRNMIVRFHPENKRRLLLGCHYDTRPFPDRDQHNPQGLFLGANDGASGVGFFFELGKHLVDLKGKYGIDLIFFDGEEFVWRTGIDPMFLGSTHFATEYAKNRWNGKYAYGIVVDMIADKELELYFEGNSVQYAPKLAQSIWGVAKELGVKEFIPEQRHHIRDDHLPLNSIARIPTVDIIDFDYPNVNVGNIYWHTEKDLPENCSAESLEKVGRVLLEWLRQMQNMK